MKNEIVVTVQRAARNWWVSVLIGVLALALGIWCLFAPGATLAALSLVFVVGFIISGILEIVFAVTNRGLDGWGWSLAGGIVDLLIGIALAVLPLAVITVVLIWFVGFWLLIRSILGIGMAADLHRWGVRGWLLAVAILGVVAAFLFFLSPAFGGGTIVWLAACAFVFYGIFRIWLGVRLYSLHRNVEVITERIR